MALIALGVTGGIGAYKAVEIARGLQKNGHDVVAMMTRSADAVRRAADLRGDHAPRGDHRSVEAGRQRRHRAHRDRVEHRPAAGRAGHRQHHRQVRQRPRRRFPVVALHRDARAGDDRAGDEHQHVRSPGGREESRDADRARRARRRSRIRLSGVRLDRQGPARRARGRRRRGRAAAAGRRRRRRWRAAAS